MPVIVQDTETVLLAFLKRQRHLGLSHVTPLPTPVLGALSENDVKPSIIYGVYARLRTEAGRVIVASTTRSSVLAIMLDCSRTCAADGRAGMAKTLLVSKLPSTMSLKFSRIQFTPDLMPMDINRHPTSCKNSAGISASLNRVHGPVFANMCWRMKSIVLHAEGRRRQCIEAMQEHKVTVVGKSFKRVPPFVVLATKPVDRERTPSRCRKLMLTGSCSDRTGLSVRIDRSTIARTNERG